LQAPLKIQRAVLVVAMPTCGTRARVATMTEIVLRVRLTGGERMDVIYEEPGTVDTEDVTEHAVTTLAREQGVLRSRHGDRLVVLYARGVAALEVAPRGAVL
jgi:hypothetical protein